MSRKIVDGKYLQDDYNRDLIADVVGKANTIATEKDVNAMKIALERNMPLRYIELMAEALPITASLLVGK